MNEIEAIFAQPKHRGCPFCGEPNVVRVLVQIDELGPGGTTAGKGLRSRSRSVSMCAKHGAERWTTAAEGLKDG